MAKTKIIVTNQEVLKSKYADQITNIKNALKEHISIDEANGIKTLVVYIDDIESMKNIGKVVADAQNQEQNKTAIDIVYNHYKPDYLMLLGSIDIIPHQELDNPLLGDGDPTVPSDLPYASDVSYSKNIQDFRAPNRKVGRLPDITYMLTNEKKDSTYLVKLLTNKNRYNKYPKAHYENYFGLSADTWKDSSSLSLRNIFGNDKNMVLSPPNTDISWTKKQLQTYTHFINCHGDNKNPSYFGQKENDYPKSISAYLVKENIIEGNITAAECCYGAQLYDPYVFPQSPHTGENMWSMCNRYLSEGCVAFFGSTTIAYGPPVGNSAADFISQYFIKNMLDGFSAGAACLKARQDFVTHQDPDSSSNLDPTDLKTLAQFNLMGDPSVQPVERLRPDSYQEILNLQTVSQIERKDFEKKAKYISENIGWSTPESDVTPSLSANVIINEIIKKENLESFTVRKYVIHYPQNLESNEERTARPEHTYLLMNPIERSSSLSTGMIVYTIKEANGEVYNIKREESKG
jgi:hypothetical protein